MIHVHSLYVSIHDFLIYDTYTLTVCFYTGFSSNHRLSPLWVRVPQVAILRTCPNMTLAVERDVKPQL